MELRVDPPDGLVDEPPRIELLGATAGRQVDLQLSVTDAAGHRWRSRGQDTDHLFWDMEFASVDVAPTAFVAAVDQLDYRWRPTAETRPPPRA
jgi:hypothetical protein